MWKSEKGEGTSENEMRGRGGEGKPEPTNLHTHAAHIKEVRRQHSEHVLSELTD